MNQPAKSGLIAPKVTEGEWRAPHFSCDDVGCDCPSILCDGIAGSIAAVSFDNGKRITEGGNDSPPTDEARANGRMLAASKKLAEALNAVLQENPSVEDWMNAKAALLSAGYTEQ
jgi:hypothetical protein